MDADLLGGNLIEIPDWLGRRANYFGQENLNLVLVLRGA
jgi:hypothetical protein